MPIRRAVTGRSQEPRARFAEELRICRQAHGKTLREVGDAITWDFSHLGRMELGETLGGPEMVQDLDRLYGTDYLLILWEIAQKDPSQFRARYRRYMAMEAEATSIQIYSPAVVPGLLQTEPYVRALLTAGGLAGKPLDTQVKARVERQHVLRAPNAPHLRVILSEAVLRTPMKTSTDWRDQLRHLLKMSELPNVSMQVLPLAEGFHALTNMYVNLLRTPEARTVAWIESGYSGELVEETAAVERLALSYDRLRDQALTVNGSLTLITELLEELPCEPSSI